MMTATLSKNDDIRSDLPLATKSGTASKPTWVIDGREFTFVKPLNKAGRLRGGKTPRLGKRVLAKYVAGVTAAGADLIFIGMFREKRK